MLETDVFVGDELRRVVQSDVDMHSPEAILADAAVGQVDGALVINVDNSGDKDLLPYHNITLKPPKPPIHNSKPFFVEIVGY